MHCLPVSVSSRQHNQNLPSNSLCDVNLLVMACPQGAGDPETNPAPQGQPDYHGPCSVPGSTLGPCRATSPAAGGRRHPG